MASSHFRIADFMGRHSLSMAIDFMIALIAATFCGTMAGMGLGGGSLLILWLTTGLHMAPEAARGMNLLFFLPTSLISTFLRSHQGALPIKKVMPAVWAGILFSAIFSYVSGMLHTDLLRRLFGGLLVITGLRELFYRPRNIK